MRCSLVRKSSLESNSVKLTSLTPKKYTYWISTLARKSQWQEAIALASYLRVASMTQVLDLRSFGAELLACSRGSLWTASLVLVEQLRAARLQMNAVTWSAVLTSMASARRWQSAFSLLQEVEEQSPHDATIVLYNNMITAMGPRWLQAFEILCRARRRRLQPTVVTLNSLLAACSLGAEWSMCLRLLGTTSFGSSDLMSLNTAIAACRNAGRWDIAWLLFTRQAGLQRKSTRKANAKSIDVVTCNTTASACADGQQWQLVLVLHKHMANRFIKPNTTTFNTMMASCAKARRWHYAVDFYRQLQESSCRSDIITVATLLGAAEASSRWQLALRTYFHYLLSTVLKPNVVANNSLLAACAAGQQWEVAMQLACGEDHLSPQDFLTHCILALMLRRGSHWKLMLALMAQEKVGQESAPFFQTLASSVCEQTCHSWTFLRRTRSDAVLTTSLLRLSLPYQIASTKIAANAGTSKPGNLRDMFVSVVQQSTWAGKARRPPGATKEDTRSMASPDTCTRTSRKSIDTCGEEKATPGDLGFLVNQAYLGSQLSLSLSSNSLLDPGDSKLPLRPLGGGYSLTAPSGPSRTAPCNAASVDAFMALQQGRAKSMLVPAAKPMVPQGAPARQHPSHVPLRSPVASGRPQYAGSRSWQPCTAAGGYAVQPGLHRIV
ncbi:unnamed protein product [Symbiodinium necroappetens]|uniref:Pentatricopeptide repeat-containing protein, chloroplastic n=1 Tax=Symbiodinium necroappetens TaxID=1628268 RepID=A0A813A234_9DINO|nr:unnamed protein product [Symbiodinium necroappetens]